MDSEEAEGAMAAADQAFAPGCCCLWVPWPFGGTCVGAKVWERMGPAAEAAEQWADGWRWWAPGWRAMIKVREWSELVAGPRWKTFIRRLGRSRSVRRGKFRYDPLSYGLNFDEGGHRSAGGDDSEADADHRDFSARYATQPSSAWLPMQLGGGQHTPPLSVPTPIFAIPAH